MGQLLFWLNKPDPQIPDTTWAGFLDGMAATAIVVISVTTALIIFAYTSSARRRKVYCVNDLFAPFTPLWWILLAVLGAIVDGTLCFWRYVLVLYSDVGQFEISVQIFLICGALTAVISYLLIAFVPQLTPAKFRYRPAPFLHKGKMAGAS